MLGWLADLFRLAGGLLYWNIRKTWFRLRRGRSPCPCQSPSDSGRALETRCDACLQWHRPARFRRVCPLLVQTKDGLRCSANTPDVRPFWWRAAGYYGVAAGAVYLAGVLVVFSFLRGVGYPVSVIEVAAPPLWNHVTRARGWYFFQRSQRAFVAGHPSEGLLYLANAYELDPSNYQIGLVLAKNYQVSQPARSDQIFGQLMRDHRDRRDDTAQDWFRALLARGDFEKIVPLARDEMLADPAHAHAWIRALLFATRHTGDNAALRALLARPEPAAVRWRPLLETELLVRAGRNAEAHAALVRPWPEDAPRFTAFYRANTLIALGDTFAAVDIVGANAALDDETREMLLLDAYAAAGAQAARQREAVRLIGNASAPEVTLLCAHLVRYPDRALFQQLFDAFVRRKPPLDSDTAGVWFSLLCTAGAVGDDARLHTLASQLKQASATPFLALGVVEAFFVDPANQRRVTSVLPILPLPLEVTYALIERYSPASIRAPDPLSKSK
ncbi:MAG TPA: hypothetical protein VHD62_13370 [Opitutaceae bacterium]|nr:hypothetical protein [Opitutaceae bacterium]